MVGRWKKKIVFGVTQTVDGIKLAMGLNKRPGVGGGFLQDGGEGYWGKENPPAPQKRKRKGEGRASGTAGQKKKGGEKSQGRGSSANGGDENDRNGRIDRNDSDRNDSDRNDSDRFDGGDGGDGDVSNWRR